MRKIALKIEETIPLDKVIDAAEFRSKKLSKEHNKSSYELGFNQCYHFILAELLKAKKK